MRVGAAGLGCGFAGFEGAEPQPELTVVRGETGFDGLAGLEGLDGAEPQPELTVFRGLAGAAPQPVLTVLRSSWRFDTSEVLGFHPVDVLDEAPQPLLTGLRAGALATEAPQPVETGLRALGAPALPTVI
ncbi:MAG: hypothetical protein ACYC8T_06530 [Myxococcaceae bacterium]